MRATRSRKSILGAVVLAAVWALAIPIGEVAVAGHGGPHADIKTWDVGDSAILGFDPHETIDDVDGLTNHVGSPTMVTSMENVGGGFCGFLFWNPMTNTFKSYNVTGGFQFPVDINRGTPPPGGSPPGTFGGGDTWATVNGNSAFSPYLNFRGTDGFRRWDAGAFAATGIRVHPGTGKVYFGNFTDPGELIELDPATNTVRKWTTGSRPYNLVIAGDVVFATGVAGGGQPDQVLRLNPATNELTRWNVPGGGFQPFVSFGTPNSIARDLEGSIWFTESATDELGRLNPATNVIDEYTKPGIDNPHSIASSGAGATLQAFFTEANVSPPEAIEHISLITEDNSTPVSAVVAPAMETVAPSTSTADPVDFTVSPNVATITPVLFDSPATDGNGIDRFPIPPGTHEPTGMTRVAFPGTVFGSMEGSDHVFEFKSEAIIAPPGEEICGDGIDNDGDGEIDEGCPPPPVEEGRMTGGGSVFAADGTRVTHGFELHCDATTEPNTLEVNWGKGNRFHLESLTSASCSDDPAIDPGQPPAPFDTYHGSGVGTHNGMAGFLAEWTFTDAGEPGSFDVAEITITDPSATVVVLTVAGMLTVGNHQAHEE